MKLNNMSRKVINIIITHSLTCTNHSTYIQTYLQVHCTIIWAWRQNY